MKDFPQFGKKLLHKIYVVTSNGAQKNRPKDEYYFFKLKYSKTSLTTLILRRLKNYLTLNFYVVIHLGFCSNLSPGFFSCPDVPKCLKSVR